MLAKTLKLLVLVGMIFLSYKSYALPTFTIQNLKGDCEGSSTGSFEVLVTSADGPVNIFILGPPNLGPFSATVGVPFQITGLAGAASPGKSYVVVVQDSQSNIANVQILSYSTALTGTINSVVNNSDCLVPNGAIDITPSGGSGVYTYLWEDPAIANDVIATTQDLTGILGGNYRVTISDVNSNCTETLPIITVGNPSPLYFNLTSPTLPVCTGVDIVLQLDGSESGVSYEVFRNNVTATGIIQVGTGGPLNFIVPFGSFGNGDNFKLRATNGICEDDMTGVIIATIVPLPTAVVSGGGSVCTGGPLPNVTFNFTGTAPYTFTYTNGVTPVTVNNHPTASFTITNAPAGTYSVTALTDANTCSATSLGGSVSVIVNALPTAVISGGGPICSGSALPNVTFTFTGTAPFTITYTNGVTPVTVNNHPTTTFTINSAPAGTYSVTALTDANTCIATSLGTPVSVIVNTLPTAAVVGGGTICSGGALPNVTFNFTGTAPYTFTYTNGVTPVTVNNHPTASFTITNAPAGTYSVTALTDANTCSATSLGGSVSVIVNALPTAVISGGGPICSGSALPNVTFTFTGTAPFTFTYTNGVTPVTVNNHPTTTFTINSAPAGTYSVTALTDANTCVATSLGTPVSVIVNTLPTAAVAGGGTICSGGALPNVTFNFTGTAPYTFTYTNGVTPVTVNNHPTASFTITNAPAGTYSVTALTDANTCSATSLGGSVSVIVNALPTAVITGGGPICSGSALPNVTFTFTGTAPFTFTYTNGVTPVTVNNHPTTTFTINSAPAGTYSVTALTDANTCVATSLGTPVSVIVNTLPTAAVAGGGTICSGGALPNVTFNFTGTAPYTFTYTNGVTPVTVNNHPTASFTITNAPAGTYSVTALTDANTCSATSLGGSVSVIVNALPTAVISGGGPICSGSALPNVTFTFTGTAPFTFTYTNGVTPVTVNNHPTTTFTINSAPAGTYSVTALTDANTCVATSLGTPVSVIVNTLPTAAVVGGGTICSGGALPNVTFNFTGTAPYTFTYTNGVTPVTVNNHPTASFTITNAPAGTYSVTALTDANTCSATSLGGSVSVIVNALPTATISGGGPICSGSALPNVTFTFTGTAPFTFTYTNGVTPVTVNNHPTTTFTINSAPAGTYSVTALTDANTCVATSLGTPVSVIVNTLPTAAVAGGGTICSGGALPNVTFNFTGTAPYTFTYTNGVTPVTVNNHPTASFTLTSAPAGTYSVTALTDANSCSATSLGGSVNVIVNVRPTAVISGGGPICSGSALPNVTFTFTGTGPFTFTYTDGVTPVTVNNHLTTSFTINNAPAGTYAVTALTDASTCAGTALGTPVAVVVNALPTADIGGTTTICTGGNTDLLFTLPSGTYDVVYTNGTTNFNANGIANGALVNVAPIISTTYTIVSVTNSSTSCAVAAPSPSITGSAVITITSGPVLVSPQSKTICTGDNVGYEILLNPANLPAGTMFSWPDPDGTGPATAGANVPMGIAGTLHINDLLTNATAAPISVTYVVTPSLIGCSGAAVPIDITVLPEPTISGILVGSICAGTSTAGLIYDTTTGSPDQLNVDFDDPSFTDITNLPLTASPVSIPVLATAAPGTYTATLTVFNGSAGCFSTGIPISVTIVGLPIPTISGPSEVCENATSNVYTTEASKSDYVWTVSAGGTITAGGGLADNTVTVTWTGLVPQNVSVNYTQNTCSAATPGTLAVNVNPTPSISGVAINPICTGVTPASLTYGAVTGSPDQYTIDFDGAAEIAGFVDVLNTSLPISPISIVVPGTTAAGTYNASFTVRNSTTGCSSPSTPISITLTPSPTATMAGTTTTCGSSPTNITVNFTGTGPWSFQYSDGTTTSPVIPSFFNSISFSVNPSTTTTYTITSVEDATVCAGAIGSSATVTVNQPPVSNLPVGVALNPICVGGSTDVTVSNSEVGVSYQLRNNAGNIVVGTPVIGTGSLISLSTGPLVANQTFNVLATATGCPPVQLTNLANVTVSGTINAGLLVTALPNPVCEGSASVIQIANSENGVLYQLRNDSDNSVVGGTVAGNGLTINLPTGVLSDTTTFNVLASNGTCTIELTDVETVNVNVNPDPALAVAVTLDPICVGGTSAVTVALSEIGVNYQLRTEPGNVNVGTAVAGTGGTISLPTGILNSSTTFNVLATSGVCPAITLTTLATVNVSGTIDATLAVTATASPICEGASTVIQVANSENGISYQLRDGSVTVGSAVVGNGSTIDLPVTGLTVTTTFNVLASNGTCSIQLTDTQLINVDPAPDAGLAVSTTLNPLCTGGVSAVTVALSQLGVNYQLRNDAGDIDIGLPVAGTGGTISLSTDILNATTSFNVLSTSGVCSSVELTQTVTITVAGTINAGLNVTSSFSPICEGTSTFIQVELSETGVNYQLRDGNNINIGAPVAGNSGTINLPTGNLTATTVFNVVASNSACSIQLTDTETITVNPSPDITLAVAPASGLICSGTSTNIVVTASENGVTYQLRNNTGNVPVGPAVVSAGGNLILPTGNLTSSTTFNVFATIGGCSAQLSATVSVAIRPIGDPACGPGGGPSDCANFSAIIPTIVTQPSCNDRDAGEVSFSISRSNGTPTTFRVIWTYNGTNQTKFTAGTVSFDDLNSGLYRYTIIDEGNGRTCGPVDFFLDLKTQVEILDKEVLSTVTCFDGTDGNVKLTVDGTTTGEYWYKYVLDGQESVAQTFTPGAPLPGGLPADDNDFIIIKVDETFAFSCPDTVMVRIKHAFPKIDFTVASTEVTTCNGTDGAIQVTGATGGNTTTSGLQARLKKEVPFSTDPSGYIVVSDFEDLVSGALEYTELAQGNYIVDVKDQIDCIQSQPIAIQAPGQVPLSLVDIIPTDASCANEGASGSIQVTINQAGIYEVAVSQDQVNVPADEDFVQYNSPSLPSVVFNNLIRGRYFLYIKSNTTECPTRSDVINIGGVYAVGDFDIISNCENLNLTLNNITGEQDSPFVIRVFSNNDKFFKIDSLTAAVIPQSNSVSFIYNAPLQHSFLAEQGTYRFVMIQTQTTGAGTCTLVSDTVVYDVRQQVSLVLGQIKPSFPDPKRTGSIELENILGGTRFVSGTNELYYEVSLTTADDDIVVFDWKQVKLNAQNKFAVVYEFLPPRVYRLKVRDASGCEKTQDIDVPLDPSVYVPNIFTPNDDERNDEFEILNLPLGGKHKLIISNRWGNQVFSSNDYREGNFWNAEGASDGVYYYRLKVEGGETFTGWVEVLRGTEP